MSQRGVSLLELLIAIVFVVLGLTMVGVYSARSARLSLDSRMRWQASEIARTQIEQLKSLPYSSSLMNATAATNPPFVAGTALNGGCNCRDPQTTLFTILPSTPIVASNITYTVQICINYVDLTGPGSSLQSHCSNGPLFDTNTKAIRVRVSWTGGSNAQSYFTETESMISR